MALFSWATGVEKKNNKLFIKLRFGSPPRTWELPFPRTPPDQKLGGGNSNMFIFTPNPGEIIQFDDRLFLKWVGSTTNQIYIYIHPPMGGV